MVKEDCKRVDIRQALTEFLGMTLFVFMGTGAAESNLIVDENGEAEGRGISGSANSFTVAAAFGWSITILAYALGHYGAGQLNPAVTVGLAIAKQLSWMQALANCGAQMIGAVLGVALVKGMTTRQDNQTNSLATNAVNFQAGYTLGNAFMGEFVCTFFLVYVVFETAVSKLSNAKGAKIEDNKYEWDMSLAPIPIGFAVLVAHIVLIPIDGCSINPARTFGSSLVAAFNGFPGAFKDHWLFWLAPMMGSALASGVWVIFCKPLSDQMGVTRQQINQGRTIARLMGQEVGGSAGAASNPRRVSPETAGATPDL
eukprot:g74406.t1